MCLCVCFFLWFYIPIWRERKPAPLTSAERLSLLSRGVGMSAAASTTTTTKNILLYSVDKRGGGEDDVGLPRSHGNRLVQHLSSAAGHHHIEYNFHDVWHFYYTFFLFLRGVSQFKVGELYAGPFSVWLFMVNFENNFDYLFIFKFYSEFL